VTLTTFIGFTLDIIGKILIGISVLMVHRRVMQEKKITSSIVRKMKQEQALVIIGLIFLILGYLLQLPGKV